MPEPTIETPAATAPVAETPPTPEAPKKWGLFDPPAKAETPPAEAVVAPTEPVASVTEVPPAPPPEEDKTVAAFAALKKRERELRQREEALKKSETDSQARAGEDAATYRRMKELFQAGRIDEATRLGFGVDPQAYFDALTSGKAPAPKAPETGPTPEGLSKELADLKAELRRRDEETAERTVLSDISKLVTDGGETFEYTAALGEQGARQVYAKAVALYQEAQEDGIPMTRDEVLKKAAQSVESEVEARLVSRLLTTKKASARMSQSQVAPKQEVRPPADGPRQPQPPPKPKTLTNSLAAVVPPRNEDSFDSLPPEERIALVAERSKGKLFD